MSVSKYIAVGRMEFFEKLHAVWGTMFWGFFTGLVLFVFLKIWEAIYAGKPVIEGFTIAQMIWYLAFAETLMFALASHQLKTIAEDVRSGTVAMDLLKPMSYIFSRVAIFSGTFVRVFLIVGAVSVVITYLLVGPIPFSLSSVPFIALSLIGALIINAFITLIFGLLAFWLEEVSAFYWIYQKLIFILGGMIVPLDIYPQWISGFLTKLPTAYIMYLPSKLFVKFSIQQFISTFIGQVLWAVIFGVLLAVLYSFAIRRVNIHGG
jgi:ABC-2 type transport system permease protein